MDATVAAIAENDDAAEVIQQKTGTAETSPAKRCIGVPFRF